MLTLKEARDIYDRRTTKASDIVRQLAFAGIAIIWLFKSDVGGVPLIPPELMSAGFLIVIGLFLDLMQYVMAAFLWGAYARRKERQGIQPDVKFAAPRTINWPALTCFWLKISMILWAYVKIAQYLYQIISNSYSLP